MENTKVDPETKKERSSYPLEVPLDTRVGAILLFLLLSLLPSSFSDSSIAAVSRFPSTLPLMELVALCVPDMGVCGGVLRGIPAGAEFAAARLGTLPRVGVGLLLTNPDDAGVWLTDEVMEETEEDRVGLVGCMEGTVAGDGARNAGLCRTAGGGGGALVFVGVGIGVDTVEEADVEIVG